MASLPGSPYSLAHSWGEKGSGPGQLNDPTGIAVTDTEVFVSDARNGRIQVFDQQGRYQREFGTTGDGLGPEGNVFVADFYNDRIQKFAADGDYLTAFGSEPENPGHTAMAVAIGSDETVWSVNFADNRVEKWEPVK